MQLINIAEQVSKAQLLALAEMDALYLIESGKSLVEVKILIHKYLLYLNELKEKIDSKALEEWQRNSRDIIFETKVEPFEVGTKYNYQTDTIWAKINEDLEKINVIKKDRETFLKALKHPVADAETGEIINPVVKSSKTQLKLTIS